ncbi:hypothetical protein K525DRAFT_245778 [Schizophyllum commune Loenen D]|nr:hypothetical protein K525DRAFT_245778 [Schizophyllum commune Loenen D]
MATYFIAVRDGGRGRGGASVGRGGGRGGGTFPNMSRTFRGGQAQAQPSDDSLTLSHAYYGPIYKKDVSATVMTDAVCNMLQVKLNWVKGAEYIFEGDNCLVLVRLENAQCCQKFVAAWRARRGDVSMKTFGLADGFDVWPALRDIGDWRALLGPSTGQGAGGSGAAAGSGMSRYGLS